MIQLDLQPPLNLSYFYGRKTGMNEAIWESVVTSLAENWVTLLECGYFLFRIYKITLRIQYISESSTHIPVYLPNLLSQRKAGTCCNLYINSMDNYGASLLGNGLVQTLRSSRQKSLLSGSFHSNGIHLSSYYHSFLCFLAIVELLEDVERVSFPSM